MSSVRALGTMAPEERRALLARLLREQGDGGAAFPLSSAQRRLWFLDQLQPGSPLYNVAREVRLEGALSPAALAAALSEITRRHQVLRAVFTAEGEAAGEPLQVVLPPRPPGLPLVDLAALPEAARQAEAGRLAVREAARPFGLARGPLLRAALLRLGDAEHVLLLTLHHAVADAWSMAILFRELGELVTAFAAGRPSPLPPLAAQYADYVRTERERLQGAFLDQELAWWRQRLAGAPALLELPADRPRPAVPHGRGGTVAFTLPAGLAGRLRELGRASRASLFMTLLAAFQALLARLTGARDLVVGTAIANRERPEWADLIGFFLNTLALRGDLSGDPPFGDLLQRVREGALAAYAHAGLPFERLVEELQPERGPGHAPLFQHMFVLDSSPPRPLALPGLRLCPRAVPSGLAKLDLVLFVEDAGTDLQAYCEYVRDLFDATTVERFAAYWRSLLAAVAADPGRRLSELPLLGPEERHQLLCEWETGAVQEGGLRDVVSLFEAHAARRPEATAVVGVPGDRPERLSYAELDRRAGRLARRLRALGVGTEARVALHLGRGLEMPVAVLGVIKAGGACLPLDPAYPPERLALMLEDARVTVVLTRRSLHAGLPATAAPVLDLDALDDLDGAAAEDGSLPARPPGSLLYVVYTSGSTGRPKGVAMSHELFANLVAWQGRESAARVPEPPVTLQFAALSFDVSFQEMFTTWSAGGTLVLVPEEMRRDAPALLDRLAATGVERLFLPVTALENLAEAAAQRPRLPAGLAGRLREIITAGEQLRVTPQVAALFERLPGCALVNHYGPSETHAVTSLCLDGPPRTWPALPPIGRPLDGARTLILDAALEPVPPGVAGELYAGGRTVGRGYFDRPDATAERFLPDPYAGEPGARLYRTGDLARVRAGGILEFLGRADDQVKLRGYRIEPAEIEAALAAHPAVREAAVALRGGPEPGSRRLVAWVVLRGGPEEESTDPVAELRAHLGARLPAYMLPSAFVLLDALPLTPSGKLDRRALPEPVEGGPAGSPALPPRTPVERELAAIWCEVLGVAAVGVEDDFFALGGHSLLATRVLSRLRRVFEVDLPLAELFAGPTIAHLAAAVERVRGGREETQTRRPAKITALSRQDRRLAPVEEMAE